MAKSTLPIPKGLHSVTPSIMVNNAPKAIEFYKKALGAEERSRFEGPDGSIMHAEIRIGDSVIMLGEEMPDMGSKSPKTLGGTPVALFLYRDNVDALWKQAIAAGAREVMPLTDQFWGDRAGCIEDPFGHRWWLAQHIKDMDDAELREAAENFFAHQQPA